MKAIAIFRDTAAKRLEAEKDLLKDAKTLISSKEVNFVVTQYLGRPFSMQDPPKLVNGLTEQQFKTVCKWFFKLKDIKDNGDTKSFSVLIDGNKKIDGVRLLSLSTPKDRFECQLGNNKHIRQLTGEVIYAVILLCCALNPNQFILNFPNAFKKVNSKDKNNIQDILGQCSFSHALFAKSSPGLIVFSNLSHQHWSINFVNSLQHKVTIINSSRSFSQGLAACNQSHRNLAIKALTEPLDQAYMRSLDEQDVSDDDLDIVFDVDEDKLIDFDANALELWTQTHLNSWIRTLAVSMLSSA